MNTSAALAEWKNDPRMAGGGAIMGLGCHVLDLCCWLLDAEPDGVSAINDADADHMDQMDLIGLSFGPCLADIQVTRRFELHPNGVVVHGTEGSLTAARTLTIDPGGTLFGTDGAELATSPQSPYVPELEAFAAAVRGEGEFHADGWDGVRSVRLTEAVLAAAR
jgi:predicted dehydrogenase